MDPSRGVYLDFSDEFPFIYVEDNATLRLRNLTAKGLYNKYSPDLLPFVEQLPRPLGFEFWPAIVPSPGSTVILSNVLAYAYAQKTCSEEYLRQVTLNQAAVLGGYDITGYIPEKNITWVLGYHEIPMSIQGSKGIGNSGSMKVIANGTSWGCLPQPQQTEQAWGGGEPYPSDNAHTSGGSSGGLSAGDWAGIGVGIAAAVLAAGLLTRYAVRRRGHQPSTPIMLPDPRGDSVTGSPSPKPRESPAQQLRAFTDLRHGSEGGTQLFNLAVERINAEHAELTIASALKIRFGSLDGLEIGNLIGRGAHGRIYKGSMRGTPVAVKVVDHTIDPGENAGTAAAHVTSEVVLLTALAHPNIVRVFRVATIKLEDRGTSFGSMGRFSDNSVTNNIAIGIFEDGDLEMGNAATRPGVQGSGISSPSSIEYRLGAAESGFGAAGRHSGSYGRSSSIGDSEPKGVLGFTGPGLYETWMVMEFCEKGSLHDAVQRRRFHRRDGTPNKVRI